MKGARSHATGRRGSSKGGGKMGYLPKEQTVKPGRVMRTGQGGNTPEAYQKILPDTPASEGTKIPGF